MKQRNKNRTYSLIIRDGRSFLSQMSIYLSFQSSKDISYIKQK